MKHLYSDRSSVLLYYQLVRTLIVFLLFVSSTSALFAQAPQRGTDFWFSFMQNITLQQGAAFVKVAIISENGATGTLELPATGFSQNFSVPAGGAAYMQLLNSQSYPVGTGTFDMGYRIQTDDTVTVAIINGDGGSDDASLIYPSNFLGFNYYVHSYYSPPAAEQTSFVIVATEDNTTVEVEVPGSTPAFINLNEGQVYQLISNNNLTGTHIRSVCGPNTLPKPIAVFSGAPSVAVHQGATNTSTRDHLMEQLHPADTWGTEFAMLAHKNSDRFYVQILAATDGTIVTGDAGTHNLDAGDFVTINRQAPSRISANQPVSVALIKVGGPGLEGDPYMITIPPLDQGATEAEFFTFFSGSTVFGIPQYLTVVTPTANTGNITLDGAAPNFSWQPFPTDPTMSYLRDTMDVNGGYHQIVSTDDVFHAYPSGALQAVSYAYTIGFDKNDISFDVAHLQDTATNITFEDTVCSCEPVTFFSDAYSGQFLWDFGDGTSGIGNPISHNYSLNGTYEVTLSLYDSVNCSVRTAILEELVVINCDILMEPDSAICAGQEVTLTSNAGSSFLWSTGDTSVSITVSPTETTTYWLQVDGGNTSICDSIVVYVLPNSFFTLPDTLHACDGTAPLLSTGLTEGDHLWSTGSTATSIAAASPGEYTVSVNTNGCLHSDTSFIIFHSNPLPPLLDEVELCIGFDHTFDATTPGLSYAWNTGDTTAQTTATTPGDYSVILTNIFGCTAIAEGTAVECSITPIIPNTITPNGDGFNDFWHITYLENYANYTLEIFNRNGQQVFQSDAYNNDWSGQWKGNDLPAGAYYYVLIIEGDREFKGAIHIIRER